ncbi:TetR/AcrR family transcriptional regulator [Streptomyces sp. NPDC001848]|uniref:TetR/AcrR family transcriptional regulator n=1 Tax=Streptomyces sp. NPDC001848 TaxID=3364618 RepID=UPI0036BAC1BA
MTTGAVDWSMFGGSRDQAPVGEGLRERKKREMRRRLSETATEMFLERGFDAVRVSEIAAACGVSEKTVFNYFPTKEALVLDRWESTLAALPALADPTVPPVEAALSILSGELAAVCSWLAAQEDTDLAADMFRRFGALLRSTPSLVAHQRATTERLIAAAAEALARRTGRAPLDPEPQIAATSLIGLWAVQFRSIGMRLRTARTPERLRRAVTADVHRAARLVGRGLDTFDT